MSHIVSRWPGTEAPLSFEVRQKCRSSVKQLPGIDSRQSSPSTRRPRGSPKEIPDQTRRSKAARAGQHERHRGNPMLCGQASCEQRSVPALFWTWPGLRRGPARFAALEGSRRTTRHTRMPPSPWPRWWYAGTARQTTGLVLRHLDAERCSFGDRRRYHPLGVALKGFKGRCIK